VWQRVPRWNTNIVRQGLSVYEQTEILYLVILSSRLATILFIASKGFSAPLSPPCPEMTALSLLIADPGLPPWDICLILFTMSTSDWRRTNDCSSVFPTACVLQRVLQEEADKGNTLGFRPAGHSRRAPWVPSWPGRCCRGRWRRRPPQTDRWRRRCGTPRGTPPRAGPAPWSPGRSPYLQFRIGALTFCRNQTSSVSCKPETWRLVIVWNTVQAGFPSSISPQRKHIFLGMYTDAKVLVQQKMCQSKCFDTHTKYTNIIIRKQSLITYILYLHVKDWIYERNQWTSKDYGLQNKGLLELRCNAKREECVDAVSVLVSPPPIEWMRKKHCRQSQCSAAFLSVSTICSL